MCTVIILRQPTAPWPLLMAANRDEMAHRPWSPPNRHWPDRPDIIAGLDHLAGGSWMGLNETGVVAAILNRVGTLGPAAGKRSRGELVLDALDYADAQIAAQALADLDGQAYRPFNMIIADNQDAFWVRADGSARVSIHAIPPGLHMITARELNDPDSPRIASYLPRFRSATHPDPDQDDWQSWAALLSDTGPNGDPNDESPALSFLRPSGFGTVCSSLLALPAIGSPHPARWLFCPHAPTVTGFKPLPLD